MNNKLYGDYDHYDISELFKQLENDLMANMRRNLSGHRQEEIAEGFNWSMWQAEKARGLRRFIEQNSAIAEKYTSPITEYIEKIMTEQFREGAKLVDKEIVKAFNNGYIVQTIGNDDFFKLNEHKIKSLIKAVQNDMAKAQNAALRKTNDVYRKVIFDAEMYAAAGTKTVNQCIDMATEDFYKKGITCIKYKNGATVDVAKYAAMAIRTANKRAFLTGEGLKRDEWGEHLVYMSSYGQCSPTCLPYQGKVYIDNVFSHPSADYIEFYTNKGYNLLSKAIAGGAFHPNCKHTLSTFFEGINTVPPEQDIQEGLSKEEQKAKSYQNAAESWDRISRFSIDEGNKREAKRKSKTYRFIAQEMQYMSNSFRPKYGKESVNRVGNIEIPVKRVDNSRFELYTDIENTSKNKAVRLTEKNLIKAAELLPKDFEMPKVCVVDFDRYGINSSAIGGYLKETNTMYINSRYDTSEKIKEYINKTKGYFSNSSELAPYLHELGHKRYEDALVVYAEKNNISVDKARYTIENKLMEYVGEKRKNNKNYIINNLSIYANTSYTDHNYSELFAECLSSSSNNECISDILKIIDLKR